MMLSGVPTIFRTPLVPHAPAWECSSRRSASKEDAERPDRHAHAEHGHDSVLRYICRNDKSSEHRSFLTLQRGNAVHDALRRKRTQSVQTGMPTRSMGTMMLCGVPAGTINLQNTARSSRSAWECISRRSASQEDAERPDRHAHAEHGHDSVLRYICRNDKSSEHRSFLTLCVGMQFTTLCVARGRRASRPACPRGAWAR